MSDEIKFPILESSDKLKNVKVEEKKKYNFPFEKLEVGQSFAVPRDFIKLSTLRTYASRQTKLIGGKFRVVDHGEAGYEVGRIE